ncbi:hypothetical protein HY410_00425 [Candidatus Gottesmanbacteria bacterium]|nr:hypothetical protein [Candidatus Gottesmanbacteria bacterium]
MKNNRGFTLIELVLYMGLFIGFLVIMADVFLATLDVQAESEASSAVQQDGRYILARLMYDAGRSQELVQPANLGQEAPVVQFLIDGVSFTYGPTGTNLVLIGPDGTNILNSSESKVTDFSAQRLGDTNGKPTLRMNFTVTSTVKRNKGPETQTFQTTIGLR